MTEPPVIITYDAAEGGALIKKTANWMLEHARAGTIPHSRIGQTIVFTPHHLAEIIRMFEKRPAAQLASRTPARRKSAAGGDVVSLKAKTPRRKQGVA